MSIAKQLNLSTLEDWFVCIKKISMICAYQISMIKSHFLKAETMYMLPSIHK